MFNKLKNVFSELPFGAAPTLILIVLILSGGYLLIHPVKKNNADIQFITFAKSHKPGYVKAISVFESNSPDVKVDLQLVDATAVSRRLEAAFWTDLEVPDVVETLVDDLGVFFRGPVGDIGFWDITDKLKETGLYDRIVKSRLDVCTSRGKVFGIPHDVHPVMIAYRRDIFEKEGISTNDIKTWDDFIRIGKKITKDIDGDGNIDRYMMEFWYNDPTHFEILFLQRGGDYFDAEGNLTMNSKLAREIIKFYIPLVAGKNKIGNDMGWGKVLTQSLENDYFVCFFCPDWRTKVIEQDVPSMKGKLALMPMPEWKPGGRRTSVYGGTMLGITKKCKDKELAWKFAVQLYFSKKDLGKRFHDMNIIPPIPDAWSQPEFAEKRPFWSNQPIGTLYTSLANDVPPVHSNPYRRFAKGKMSEVLIACVDYYKKNGETGFEDFIKKTLDEKTDEVKLQMTRNPYQ